MVVNSIIISDNRIFQQYVSRAFSLLIFSISFQCLRPNHAETPVPEGSPKLSNIIRVSTLIDERMGIQGVVSLNLRERFNG